MARTAMEFLGEPRDGLRGAAGEQEPADAERERIVDGITQIVEPEVAVPAQLGHHESGEALVAHAALTRQSRGSHAG